MGVHSQKTKSAEATVAHLARVFTVPEAPDSTLSQVERGISENLLGFLRTHEVATPAGVRDIERFFSDTQVPERPTFVSEQADFLLENVVSRSVHTASPYFIGHMTSALPHFMLALSKIMIALNQNLVKVETSKAFTPLERQVLGMLHRMVYGGDNGCDETFYETYLHRSSKPLGVFCSGGTIANVTALWAARNRRLGPDGDFPGVKQAGLFKALRHHGYEDVCVLVSERGHYSLRKAMDILGLGRDALVTIPTNRKGRVEASAVEAVLAEKQAEKVLVLAVVGVAGATETGHIDPLNDIADVAESYGVHYHVDAAWGGPVLMSSTYRHLLDGISRADSVTLDAHKQLYVPMGAGMLLFKSPTCAEEIIHHANYVLRKGSRDLGAATLEGSRPGMAMLVHSALRVFGRQGFELLMNQGIELARAFATLIASAPDFQLMTAPETNILTYRYVPASIQSRLGDLTGNDVAEVREVLNQFTVDMQKAQRERGHSFVSRTTLNLSQTGSQDVPRDASQDRASESVGPTVVFRVVLANPLTTPQILREVLDEQRAIASRPEFMSVMNNLQALLSTP